LRDPAVLTVTPEQTVAILRSARSATPDPRLENVLASFRREWQSLGRRRYPGMGEALDDALQTALLKIISPEKLDSLKDPVAGRALGPEHLHPRGHGRGARPPAPPRAAPRDRARRRRGGVSCATSCRPPTQPPRSKRLSGRGSPSCPAASRARVAKLRFVEDLPEKEIAERLDLSRDGVAGQLKRIRKAIRNALEGSD
jgi:hypothetical protein